MIADLALLFALQTSPPPPADSGDVVVIARKLEEWRALLVFQDDVPTCRVTASSGDAAIDAIGCDAMVGCFVATKPRFLALSSFTGPRRARNRLRVEAARELDSCLETTRWTAMETLARQREQATP